MSTFSPDELRAQLRAQKIPEHLIERAIVRATVHDARQEEAETLHQITGALLAHHGAAEEADEKEVAARGVQQVRALGFVVANYSQPRSTKQTPGVQDKELFHPGRGIFLKWEVKTPRGKPSPDQVQYAEWCRACGVPYLCGTDRDLFDWLLARYPLVVDEQGHLIWRNDG